MGFAPAVSSNSYGPCSQAWRCGAHEGVGEAVSMDAQSHRELQAPLLPADGGCPCWAPELFSVLFHPGCQPGKQSSQPKQEQVGKNGSNIPACHQWRFQSNGAGEVEPVELPDE